MPTIKSIFVDPMLHYTFDVNDLLLDAFNAAGRPNRFLVTITESNHDEFGDIEVTVVIDDLRIDR